jgi:hypothetical protein
VPPEPPATTEQPTLTKLPIPPDQPTLTKKAIPTEPGAQDQQPVQDQELAQDDQPADTAQRADTAQPAEDHKPAESEPQQSTEPQQSPEAQQPTGPEPSSSPEPPKQPTISASNAPTLGGPATAPASAAATAAPDVPPTTPPAPDLPPADLQREVTVVPGVPRYHNAHCILIRFMGENDLEKTTLGAARESGCTPCRACLPDQPESNPELLPNRTMALRI